MEQEEAYIIGYNHGYRRGRKIGFEDGLKEAKGSLDIMQRSYYERMGVVKNK